METPCVLWDKCISPRGYGQLRHDGKTVQAHRLAYVIHNGLSMKEIQGKVIRHRCDNPACVNPNHLEVGTQADNMKDMYQRGRRAIGEKSGASKLTLSQVEEIKKRYEKHSRTNGTGALSVEFGVCRAAIWNVVKGHSWSTDAE